MADKPILFSGPMVRCLLAGTKTQTRRTMKVKPNLTLGEVIDDGEHSQGVIRVARSQLQEPRIAVGDRLYVREHWRTWAQYDAYPPSALVAGTHIAFEATECPTLGGNRGKLRIAMHMPRWASRITLTVTGVRVERLQDITEADAIAEGMTQATADAILTPDELAVYATTHIVAPAARGRILFETLWDQINGRGAWEANPWVAAYTFTVALGNIDPLRAP